jgi:hypothetical protein
VFARRPAEPEEWFHELRAALEELSPRRESRPLGYRLRSFRRRVFAGRYLDTPREKAHGSARWAVHPATGLRSVPREQPSAAVEADEGPGPGWCPAELFAAGRSAGLPG